ncbi:MAG TPA: M1 family metallopeptidase, partial [Dehalococcoidia bacterium]|nr:M1 family metallopeptidase [Dehalococcoidia bacterium]
IPDFAAGAMENMGAATFRETALLLDERTATHLEFERIADVEAHEIAHMWFGDLVTMRWWNGLWLKEAFATFMALVCTDAWKPEWDVWTGFSTSKAGALLVDGLRSTRPIEYTVVRPEDANGMYDVLTYEKGASVLRMLQQYLGEEVFRQGISAYLRKHQYGNTETSDLWDALEAASEEPVRRVADSWIFQPGYPLISATRRGDYLALSQEKFQYVREGESEAAQHWDVPLAVRFETPRGPQTEKVLLSGRSLDVPVPQGTGAIVVNAGGDGVFRVRYAPDMLQALTGDVQSTLSAIERFNLVNDTWASVQAGYVPLAEYLELTKRFRDELDPNVWSIILGSYGSIRRLAAGGLLDRFEALVREQLGAVYRRLGWQPEAGESGLTRQLRGQVLGAMGTLGNDPDVQARAREALQRFLDDPTSVDADVAAASVGIVAYAGGEAEWNEYWRRYKQARTPQEERRFMFSLVSFRQRELVERALAHTLDGEIRTQDGAFEVAQAIMNPDQGEAGWRFMTSHWDELLSRFPDNTIIRMVEGVVALSTPDLATEVQEFFAGHRVPDAGKRLDQTLERLQIAVRFRAREADNLAKYLG